MEGGLMMRRRQFSLLPAALLPTPAFASLDDSLQRLQQQWRPRLAWRSDPSWRARRWQCPAPHPSTWRRWRGLRHPEVLAEETRAGGVLAHNCACASRRANTRRPSSCALPALDRTHRAAAARPRRTL